MRVLQVRAEDARTVWPEIKEYMEKAAKRVEHLYDAEDILVEVERGIAALLISEEEGKIFGAVTIRIKQFPKAKVASADFLGGIKMWRWIGKIIQAIDIYAKENNCKYTDMVGRRGWLKVWGGKEMGTWVVREL